MKGITGRPTAGVRLSVEKADESPGEVTYRGFVHLPDADLPADVRVALPGGAVRFALAPGSGHEELEKWAAALVRAATKAPAAAGAPLPRKIVRWRG